MSDFILPNGWQNLSSVPVRLLGSTGTDGDSNHNHYHTRRSWNSDFSYIYLIHNGPGNTWTCALHDGTTGAWIKDLWTIASRDWRAVWSKVHPNIIYTNNLSTGLIVHDVVSNTVLQTFTIPYPCSVSGLSLNQDGTRIMLPRGTSETTIYALNANGTIGAQVAHFTPSIASPLSIELGNPRMEFIGSGNRIMYAAAGHYHVGTSQAGTTTEVTLAATASTETDYYKYSQIWMKFGPAGGEGRPVIGSGGTPPIATVSPGFSAAVGANQYEMDSWAVLITEEDGTPVYTHTGLMTGHYGFGFGKLVSARMNQSNTIPLRITVRNIDGTGSPLVVYEAGGGGLTKPNACSSLHMTWPQQVSDRFFVSFQPYVTNFPYNYDGSWGAYVAPTGITWNSPNSEVNVRFPYDELMLVRTTDNWATQGGIVIRYLGRCLSNGGGLQPSGKTLSFWTEPLVSPRPDGKSLAFQSIHPAATTIQTNLLTEETPMAWAVTVRIPRHADPEVVNYKTYLGGIYQATVPQPASGDPQYTYAMAIDGDYVLTSTALDASGNESPQSPALNVHLDHIAPAAPAVQVFVSSVWS